MCKFHASNCRIINSSRMSRKKYRLPYGDWIGGGCRQTRTFLRVDFLERWLPIQRSEKGERCRGWLACWLNGCWMQVEGMGGEVGNGCFFHVRTHHDYQNWWRQGSWNSTEHQAQLFDSHHRINEHVLKRSKSMENVVKNSSFKPTSHYPNHHTSIGGGPNLHDRSFWRSRM